MKTKKNVCVKLTKKNPKKVLGILEMFGENVYHGDKDRWGNGIVFHEDTHAIYTENEGWKGFNNYQISSSYPDQKEVKPRELRNILAKEHLKAGDFFIGRNNESEFVGIHDKIEDDPESRPFAVSNWRQVPGTFELKNSTNDPGWFEDFLRYATDEEKALLEPNLNTMAQISFATPFPTRITRTFRKIEIAEFIGIPVEQLEIID